MSWAPRVGEPLPRAAEAWCEQIKLEGWVLAPGGHGPGWQRVFGVGVRERERVWEAIAAAVRGARIATVRDRGAYGIVCGVELEITIDGRTAPVTVSWHYSEEGATPRLVTAYVTL